MLSAIKERIGTSLANGVLPPFQVPEKEKHLQTFGDLLQPWEEIYPGQEEPEDEDVDFSVFRHGALRKPHLVPMPRCSRRPLPLPRKVTGLFKKVRRGMFLSVQAVWQWYQEHGMSDPKLTELPLEDSGFYAFLAPGEKAWPYPLDLVVERRYMDETPFEQMPGISLQLPCYSYDFEESGVVQAFMEGASGVTWLIANYLKQEGFLDLPKKDLALIEEVRIDHLVATYEAAAGKTSYDLVKLKAWEETFFGDVASKWPEQYERDWEIISADGGYDNEIRITCKADIDFAVAYERAFSAMIGAMPEPEAMEQNDSGITEEFVHELCEVWRRQAGRRPVKWKSSKRIEAEGHKR